MTTQILKPNQVVQPRILAHKLLGLVATHIDTFMTKNRHESASWGEEPEIVVVAAHGDLGAINPKSAQPRAMLGKRLRSDARVQDPSDLI